MNCGGRRDDITGLNKATFSNEVWGELGRCGASAEVGRPRLTNEVLDSNLRQPQHKTAEQQRYLRKLIQKNYYGYPQSMDHQVRRYQRR